MGKILAVCLSETTGVQKKPVAQAECVENHGFKGDAHARDWHRQVSLLAEESIEQMRRKGIAVGWGDFGENLVTQGFELKTLPIGQKLRTDKNVILEVTQIGKVSHGPSAIYALVGASIIPTEGIFCRVLQGGKVRAGDSIDVIPDSPAGAE